MSFLASSTKNTGFLYNMNRNQTKFLKTENLAVSAIEKAMSAYFRVKLVVAMFSYSAH